MSAPVESARPVRAWPLLLLAAPAGVAIWTGWVGLGELTGFGTVHPLPGIWDDLELDTAITLPIGVEAYAGYALRAWLTPGTPERARRFAKRSAIGALILGALGQVAYHLMAAAHVTAAPWPITTVVACLPVAVLGMGAALAHLLRDPGEGAETGSKDGTVREERPAEVRASGIAVEPDRGRTGPLKPEPDRGRTRSLQAERHRTAPAALSAPVRSGPDVTDLLPAGRWVAAQLASEGRALSRSVLLARLREAGWSCSTERAGVLLALLRTEEPDRTDAPDRTGRSRRAA